MLEISVRISNEDQSYVKKYLSYDEDITLNRNDPKLNTYVEQALGEFKGIVGDVVVRVKMIW